MSDMVNYIGEVAILCTKISLYYCVQQIWALYRNAADRLEHGVQIVLIAIPIYGIYNSTWTLFIHHVLVYRHHFYAMPIFVVHNNI